MVGLQGNTLVVVAAEPEIGSYLAFAVVVNTGHTGYPVVEAKSDRKSKTDSYLAFAVVKGTGHTRYPAVEAKIAWRRNFALDR